MKMWWGPRIGRVDFLFAIILLNIAYLLIALFLFNGFSLLLQVGLRSAPGSWGVERLELTLLKLGFDFLLVSLCYRRLQDANYPGWYIFLWAVSLWLLSLLPVLGLIAVIVALFGMIGLFFFSPTIGPNRFGPDPRGWKSLEHYNEQQERLRTEK